MVPGMSADATKAEPVPGPLAGRGLTARDVLAKYPLLREDHLRYLRKWSLIGRAPRPAADTGFSFADLGVLRQVQAELERGTPFRAVLRALQSSSRGQMAFDFRIEAEPAKVILLARPSDIGHPRPARGGETAEQFFRDGSALDDGDPRKAPAAARAYRRSLEIDPSLVPAMINLANIHYAQEHLPEAEALYERAIEFDPNVFEAHFNLGNVHHDLGRLDEARAAYEGALRLNADYADAHFYLAVTLEKLGRSQQARTHWRRYRELAPNGEWVQLASEFGE
jgi:Tfp pilus assembly protein PilF